MKQKSNELETVKEESSVASSEGMDYYVNNKPIDEKNIFHHELNNYKLPDTTAIGGMGAMTETIVLKPSNLSPGTSASTTKVGSTIYTNPITVVNHIRTSFDDGEIEITVYDNPRRTSTTSSATFSGKHIWYGVTLFTLIIMTSIIATMMIMMKPHMQDNTIPDDGDDDFDINDSWYVKKNIWMQMVNQSVDGTSTTTTAPMSTTSTRRPGPGPGPGHIAKIQHPATVILLAQTKTASCANISDCTPLLFELQAIENDLFATNDYGIGYNFLVSTRGVVFEGRGANHIPHYYYPLNHRTMLIGCIGTFNSTKLPGRAMLNAITRLLEQLIKKRKVSRSYELIGDKRLWLQKPIKRILEKLLHLVSGEAKPGDEENPGDTKTP